MKKRKSGRLAKLDKYLYKNSYLYKWGKRLLKNRIGRTLVLVAFALLILNTGYSSYKVHKVKQFLRNWQQYQNKHQYQEFIRCIDLSPDNPDRLSFPDWKGHFFDVPVRLHLSDMSVDRIESGLYKAEMTVSVQEGKGSENRFRGIIYIRDNDVFHIIRVEV